MDILSVMIQAIVAGHPNGWGLAITALVSAAVCFISYLRYKDRERDRALLARADISEAAKKEIKETMDTAPGGKMLLAFLLAGTILSGLVRDEVLQLAERRRMPDFNGEITTASAANKPSPDKPCIPRCAPGSECHNGKCSAVANQPPPSPSSRLVNVPGVSPGENLFFAGSLFQ